MLFNSYVFIFVYLPITLAVFFISSKYKLIKFATISLVVSSLVFYAYWSVKYLPLLMVSILFNYLTGRKIENANSTSVKRKVLVVGVGIDLLLLGYFKYTGFFISTINAAFHSSILMPDIVLPLGISFFTFTQLAYLVDTYRGETKNYNLLTYSLFVTFFPHLIAGPILDHKRIIPQFHNLKNFIFSHKHFSLGLTYFFLGLAKKVLVADNLALWVKPVFDNPLNQNFLEAWIGALSYTMQLYFDFSGYSDMAVGLGLMLNIKLPINFNSPYKSLSIIEFWKRWHITLSEFLKSYVYIPLGGNRRGSLRKMINLLITMLLGGLWHGAGWTYVIWGGMHGIYLVINHTWRKMNFELPRLVSWCLTFIGVVIAWVFFRAQSIPDAIAILRSMTDFGTVTFSADIGNKLAWLCILVLWTCILPNTQDILRSFRPRWQVALAIGTISCICLFMLSRNTEFLYFEF